MEQQQLDLENGREETSQAKTDQTNLPNPSAGFQIRPPLPEKFKSLKVKEIISTVLTEQLSGKTYNASQVEEWVKAVVENVQAAVKQLDFPRYKIIVQTVLGEHRGSGVKVGARCLWDADTDNYASDCFFNDEDAKQMKEQRVAEYAAKKSKKPVLIAKSSIILDVKPWDDETDMKVMETEVRKIVMDGLLWGASKLVPLAYGIHKLHISCVVEDEKVSVDALQEQIEEISELVQSVDIAAFNKI